MSAVMVLDVIAEFYMLDFIMNQLSYEMLDERFKSKGFVPAGSLKRAIGETISLLKGANT